MKVVKIYEESNDNQIFNYDNDYIKIIKKNTEYYTINKIKLYFEIILIIFLLLSSLYLSIINLKHNSVKSFGKYLNDCRKHKKYNRIRITNTYPYFSICISALNMEKYIKHNIFSIINQSFQDFEIIVVNDNSNDNTEKIIREMQEIDNRITIINHSHNLGVYKSRIESILKAKGKYILLMDPDDMYLNENLLQKLYEYNININIDIIEFSVYRQIEKTKKLFYPDNHFENHYHGFKSDIIYQPDLSNLLFFSPNKNEYSYTICRNIWNKIIKKEIFLNMYNYIGVDYFNEFIITADDMCMNVITYHFAHNYSNIELPGYLYNIRETSMSNGDGGINLNKIRSINYLLYFQVFYKYIKEFNKDRNYLFYEMQNLNNFLINIKDYNIKKYKEITIHFLNEIIKDKCISYIFKKYLKNLLQYFSKK